MASLTASELLGAQGPPLGLVGSALHGRLSSSRPAQACPHSSRVPRGQIQKPPGLLRPGLRACTVTSTTFCGSKLLTGPVQLKAGGEIDSTV